MSGVFLFCSLLTYLFTYLLVFPGRVSSLHHVHIWCMDLLELELQAIMSNTWVLGIEPEFSGGTASAFNH